MGRKGSLRFVHKRLFRRKVKFNAPDLPVRASRMQTGAYEFYVAEMQGMKERLREEGFRCGGSAGMVCV